MSQKRNPNRSRRRSHTPPPAARRVVLHEDTDGGRGDPNDLHAQRASSTTDPRRRSKRPRTKRAHIPTIPTLAERERQAALHTGPSPGSRRPAWVPDDRIYNDTGRAYHYPQPIRTMAHIPSSQADNTLMNHLQHKLQTALYFSALDPSLMPVHLQTGRAQLLLDQLPLLDRVARWYGRRGIEILPEYTICACDLQQPETWENFKRCPLTQGGNHLATWTPEDTRAQHAGSGPATPLANEVRRLMRQPEIKEAVLMGGVPLRLYRVIADHAPEARATIRHMQFTAVKRADAQLQHRVQVYAQEAQQTSHDRRMYYNLLIHYQHAQPSD